MMRAIVQRAYGAADVLRLQDIAAPDPGPHDVLVGVHAASVNHGDWFATCGRPYVMRAAFGMRRPRVAVRGLDLAGRVAAVMPATTRAPTNPPARPPIRPRVRPKIHESSIKATSIPIIRQPSAAR
jgi:NADPH:quinone reductase-like Zn-dependent oxidoreductase